MRLAVTTALAAAFIGAGTMIADNSEPTEPRPVESEQRVFTNPTVDGKRIDIRYAGHMVADPKFTAEQYCREQGYTRVAYYVIRPSGATRTMGDGVLHVGGSDALSSFRMIACGHVGTQIAAERYLIGR